MKTFDTINKALLDALDADAKFRAENGDHWKITDVQIFHRQDGKVEYKIDYEAKAYVIGLYETPQMYTHGFLNREVIVQRFMQADSQESK